MRHLVPYWGTRRRLEALVACGWPVSVLEARIGSPSLFRRLGRRPRIRREWAEAVVRLYEELWDVPPPDGPESRRARARGERHGWPRPMEWDDELLDLPPDELAAAVAARVAAMDRLELAACATARYREGDRSPVIVAAAKAYKRLLQADVRRRRRAERERARLGVAA